MTTLIRWGSKTTEDRGEVKDENELQEIADRLQTTLWALSKKGFFTVYPLMKA